MCDDENECEHDESENGICNQCGQEIDWKEKIYGKTEEQDNE